jgi:hypothetical protein
MKTQQLLNGLINGFLTALASLFVFGWLLIVHHLLTNVTASELALMF